MAYEPDWGSVPDMPEYNAFDPSQYYSGLDAGAPIDTAGYDAMKTYALRDPSKDPNSLWGQMMLDKQGTEETDARSRAAAEASGALAQARSNLAQRGGLSSGAAERLGSSGIRDSMMRGQDISRQGIESRQGINLSDEENRLKAMTGLQGQANMVRSSQQQDYQNQLAAANAQAQMAAAEAARKQGYDTTAYEDQLKRWMGEQEYQTQAAINAANEQAQKPPVETKEQYDKRVKDLNTLQGTGTGMLWGTLLGGPIGSAIGSAVGAGGPDKGLIGKKDLGGNEIVAPNTPGASKDIFGNWILKKG